MMEDRNFDDLAERLKTRVYGSPKGRLRIDMVWEDLLLNIPGIQHSVPMTILDAGGGMGQISLKLARLGHQIVLCDISKNMIEQAEVLFGAEKLESCLTLVHGPFQKLQHDYGQAFDLVLSHAVLEWLADPRGSLNGLIPCLKPHGWLSLLFYNVNALILQNAIKGNLKKIKEKMFKGNATSLTPHQPLDPAQVMDWLSSCGLSIDQITGIRVFYDYMYSAVRKERLYDDIWELEHTYCRQEPFALMGKYIHLIGHDKQEDR
ncbi:MAG: methyltransferase domain-containing protein [Proteobacteria bacterium]|nr:methyltransferase domain-containing protein [Pseudomonadota bacterium]